jgi:glycosyltransferase involved in cell wall biosynthesis
MTEILAELDKIISPGIVQVVVPADGKRNLPYKNIEVVRSNKIKNTKISTKLWNNIGFPNYVKKNHGYAVDLTLTLPVMSCDIVAIHDCITELFPQNANTFINKVGRRAYIRKVKKISKKCRCIITVSESAKDDIVSMYNFDSDRVHIIPNGWQHFDRVIPEESVLDRYGLNDKEYFFSLGSRFYHKNFKWVLQAAKKNPRYTFVVSGSNRLNTSDSELDMEKPDNLIFTGYLSDGQVKALMKHCKAFIQPSLYEGFGIPPMEAMSTGADCIVSNASSLPEVYGESVWYIDPYDYENMNLDEIMSGEKKSNQLVLDKYSWKDSAEKLKEVLFKYLT